MGVAESILPPILFSISYAITRDGVLAVLLASITALGFLGYRIATRQRTSGAIVGVIGVGFAAFLALREGGQTLDYFVPGFFTNAAYAAGLLISIIARRPLLGFVLGFLTGTSMKVLSSPLRRLAYLLTFVWVGFFLLRLFVQVPLYFAANLELLSASRAILGAPAYAGLLALTWVIIRPVMNKSESV